tara:strand:- start:2743 stop:3366 length:624 start_codon:yes stop_codon:yes gene_type:complete
MYKQKNYYQLLNDIEGNSKIKELIVKTEVSANDLSIYVNNENLYDLLKFLRDDEDFLFSQLTDLCGVDWPENEIRFQVVYNLLSMSNNSRIRVKTFTDNNDSITSVSKLFSCAEWYEREAYDLFGINFKGNKDLRRLLTDYGFEGHPLRKDFPLTGYVEVRYDDVKKRVVYEPVELKQEFRSFDFESPWEGIEYPDNVLESDSNNDK